MKHCTIVLFEKYALGQLLGAHSSSIDQVAEELGVDVRDSLDVDLYLEFELRGRPFRYYIIPFVSEDTEFQPNSKGEIAVSGILSSVMLCLTLPGRKRIGCRSTLYIC